MSLLSDCGPSDQVLEIAQDYMDGDVAGRLISKAVLNGVKFTGAEIEDMLYYVDMGSINQALKTAQTPFTEEQVWNMYGIVDTEVLKGIAKKSGIPLEESENTTDNKRNNKKLSKHQKRNEFLEGAGTVMLLDRIFGGKR